MIDGKAPPNFAVFFAAIGEEEMLRAYQLYKEAHGDSMPKFDFLKLGKPIIVGTSSEFSKGCNFKDLWLNDRKSFASEKDENAPTEI